jgi:DNA (cytosine-5)-methyltransferase 1
MTIKKYNAVDLYSGIGGLSCGLREAGFRVVSAIEFDEHAIRGYRLNYPRTKVIKQDIRMVNPDEILEALAGEPLHLLAGCPPCQGFSSLRRKNRRSNVRDKRNELVLEYLRFVKALRPLTIMMENVAGLSTYYLFRKMVRELKSLGYDPKFKIVDVKDYGVPQRRKRLVLVGSLFDGLVVTEPNCTRTQTVRDSIGELPSPEASNDHVHRIYATHTPRIQAMIAQIPKDGGSRKDLPKRFELACHKKENVGFDDVYGRLKWDACSTTITGGCLNPSKGRFLHPEQNRGLTAREASLLQTFPMNYKFPVDIPKTKLALLIGNALPPLFSKLHSKAIREHLKKNLRDLTL